MHFNPLSATIPHVTYACLGGFVVLFGMFSLFLREKLYIGEACWAFLFGVIIGPYGAGIFDPRGWAGGSQEISETITLEFTRVVLAIGVFAIGVELPKAYMARHWKSLFFLLVPVMTWGWFVSAGLIYALIPKLNFLSSLVVAACLTPTDPILAAAVVGGKYADKHVPAHLRHLLAAESGCNDGAAFPFLYIALYLILDAPNTGQALKDWFLILWLYEIVLGCIIGAALGFAFRYLMKFCQSHDLIDRQSFVAQYVSLAMLTIGVTTIIGADDLLAAFACGSAFAWDGFFNGQTEESVFSSVIDLLFNVGAFVYVGAWMPFRSFQDPETSLSVWRLVVVAILVFLLKRLPIMVALFKWIPDIKTFREALFIGHFGPIGIGAIFISTLALEILQEGQGNSQTEILSVAIQPIVAFMVLCSIIIHGLSIPSFSLGRRVHSVSRTWSRHTAPDWTNQTRLVQRGDDIVINRDLEIGGGSTPYEKSVMENQKVFGPRLGIEAVDITPEKSLELGSQEPRVVQEWKEGGQNLVERSGGPGEDVEVEVTDRAHSDARVIPPILDDFSVASCSDKPKTSEKQGVPNGNVGEPEGNGAPPRTPADGDEDAGWNSENSDGVTKSEATDVTDRKKSSKPSKQKISPRGRRHSLTRKKWPASHAERFVKLVNPFEAKAGNRTHGRAPSDSDVRTLPRPNSAPSTQPSTRLPSPSNSRPSSLRNLRLEHVRRHGPSTSRDVSPSRIRFADDGNRSDSSTPRISLPSEPSSPGLGDERNKVTFAVPD